MRDCRLPIGLFDSGIGGLTVLRALWDALPEEDYLYLGDTARLPYGSKSRETVERYALQATAALVERGIKLLVIACNTATASALPALCAAYPALPVLGVVDPGADAACAQSLSGRIAVIATESTIRSRSYENAILRRRPEAAILSRACPLFVPLAEEGLVDGPLVEGIAARYLDDIFRLPREQGKPVPDCLVLGCTHFPLLSQAIGNVAGKDVALVDSSATTAESARKILDEGGMRRAPRPPGEDEGEGGVTRFLTTDDVERFTRLGACFLGRSPDRERVELVDI